VLNCSQEIDTKDKGSGNSDNIVFDINNYKVKTTEILSADGAGGTDTYTLIRNKFGTDSIEAPDLYSSNHTGFTHIQEGYDALVGNYFIFYIHRDLDKDRDYELTEINKQRNEIKIYAGSSDSLKCINGETFIYQWKFYINSGMTVSTKFTHLFQIKAVDGDDQQPIITITGFKSGINDYIEIRHNSSSSADYVVLDRSSWADIKGRWISVECIMFASDKGYLKLTVRSLDGSITYLSAEKNNIDMWREAASINRPKWGIYRSLEDIGNLRTDEETVYFSDFTIKEMEKK